MAGWVEVACGDKAGSDMRFCSVVNFLLVFLCFITACNAKLDLQMCQTCLIGQVLTVVHRVRLFCLGFRKVNVLTHG